MNTNVVILSVVAIGLIIFIGWSVMPEPPNVPSAADEETSAPTGDQAPPVTAPTTTEVETDTTSEVTQQATSASSENSVTADSSSPGSYRTYSQAALQSSPATTKLVFFAASWCPSCHALDQDIQTSADSIPNDVAIFKADFDSEITLRQRYDVTTQHTIVQVDDSGALIKKWSGGNTLEAVLAQL